MALNFASEFSVYLPELNAQVIAFIRDPKAFRLNRYCQMVPTDKMVFEYWRLGVDNSVRAVSLTADAWPDGQRRPKGHHNKSKFDEVVSKTTRRNDSFDIGNLTAKQSVIKLLDIYSKEAQSQHMTKRTARLLNAAQTVASWGANTATAAALANVAGAFLDKGSSEETNPFFCVIKKTFDAVITKVMLLTNGMVDEVDTNVLKCVMSPNQAFKISETGEIHAYLKSSPDAASQVRGRTAGLNKMYGLPDNLYGVDIEVENAMIVEQQPDASDAIGSEAGITGGAPKRHFIKNDSTMLFASRVGGLDGVPGAPSFSTLQIFHYGSEMEVETRDEAWDRLTEGGVVSNVFEALTAPASGFCVTDVLSPPS